MIFENKSYAPNRMIVDPKIGYILIKVLLTSLFTRRVCTKPKLVLNNLRVCC